jgi:hypothetical protein
LAVAAGFARRLAYPADLGHEVQERLQGKVPERISGPQAWAEALTDAQVRSLDELALAELDGAELLLGEIEEANLDDDEAMSQRAHLVLLLCERREELACAEVVLQACGRRSRALAVLPGFDRAASAVVSTLTRPRIEEDSRMLLRAAVGDPEAWWVAPLDDLD